MKRRKLVKFCEIATAALDILNIALGRLKEIKIEYSRKVDFAREVIDSIIDIMESALIFLAVEDFLIK